jgi:ABC-type sulfate transport system permease component
MKIMLKALSFAGLALTIVPSILVWNGIIAMKIHYLLMTIGLALWFTSAPFWMRSKPLGEENEPGK